MPNGQIILKVRKAPRYNFKAYIGFIMALPAGKKKILTYHNYCIAIKTTGKKFGLNEKLLNFNVQILNQAVSLANITFLYNYIDK